MGIKYFWSAMIYMYVLKLGDPKVCGGWLRGFLNAEGNKRDGGNSAGVQG